LIVRLSRVVIVPWALLAVAWGQVHADTTRAPAAVLPPVLVPHKAAIASAHPLASAAGREILEQGGNAFDAAVAVSAALAVVEGSSSGLGGGGFYLLRHADGSSVMVDARETAPAAASRDMYLDAGGQPIANASTDGALAAAIPGEPAAFEHLARKYGKLPLKASLAPAIRLAREGFPMYARLQGGIRIKRSVLLRSPAAARVFLTADGAVPEIGTLIKQPDLADTLEVIAERGARGFYRGHIAQEMVDGVRAAGGIWTLDDLASYHVVERKPLVDEYRGARIVSAPPPSSGGVAIVDALNILSGYDLTQFDTATRKHLIIEAMRRAFRDRAVYLGDPDFVRVPVALLTNPAYAAGQRASIRSDKAMPSALLPGVDAAPTGMNTTHFSVLDVAGNAVAATISVNLWLGSGFMPEKTGVLLNDTMDDFSVKPDAPNAFGLVGGAANAIAPGKRPLSSMSPTFVLTPKGMMITGSPGGSTIISMVLLSVLNYVQGMSAAGIVNYPRYHQQFLPDVVDYEADAFTPQEIAALEAKGQRLQEGNRRWGNMQVVTWDFASGAVDAASDPRGEGEGLVY
jgi:gamma-glutamyltranspeptidase/glutathione hydrolase